MLTRADHPPWLREAVKWHLGTMLESGALRWTTVSQERLPCLLRFDRWLTRAFDDPREVLGDPAAARPSRPRRSAGGTPTQPTARPAQPTPPSPERSTPG